MNDAAPKQDYKHTISLPETAFPMKGDLPRREPGILAGWQAEGLYEKVRAASKGDASNPAT